MPLRLCLISIACARQERNAVDVAFKSNTAMALALKRLGGRESTERPAQSGPKRYRMPSTWCDGRASDHKGGRRWL